jgi:hypothetical protein
VKIIENNLLKYSSFSVRIVSLFLMLPAIQPRRNKKREIIFLGCQQNFCRMRQLISRKKQISKQNRK